MSDSYETVIGLEVHVQLATGSKLFCACPNRYGSEPNTHICPVCTGQPGALPVLNAEALMLAVKAGLALECETARITSFDRKNYFYPDLPKGYQISQLESPVNGAGLVSITGTDGTEKVVNIVRAHLEEDAGKTAHPDGSDHSLVDLNRAGVPLLEIVTAPDIRNPQDAHLYLTELKRRLRFAHVSDCDMEKGSLRCDANISIRPQGETEYGTRVEIKNLNSFRNVEKSLEHEVTRQRDLLISGGKVSAETRMWREEQEDTYPLRSKEEDQDYRYFPDPDLPYVTLDQQWVNEIQDSLPETAKSRRQRYVNSLGLPEHTADVLVADRDPAEYFERCLEASSDETGHEVLIGDVANFVISSAMARANDEGVSLSRISLTPESIVEVVRMTHDGTLSNQAARKVLAHVAETGVSPAKAVKKLGLAQISDVEELGQIVDSVIAESEQAVSEYLGGKESALNSLVGAVMKATGGKANPNLSRELLKKKIGKAGTPDAD